MNIFDKFGDIISRARGGDSTFALPTVDLFRLELALLQWPKHWKNSFYVELFGSFRLSKSIHFCEHGITINADEHGPSSFGATWFYSCQIKVESRDIDGYLNGIDRLEHILGALHLASCFLGTNQLFMTNRGPGSSIQYRCRFSDESVAGAPQGRQLLIRPNEYSTPDLSPLEHNVLDISKTIRASTGRAGESVNRAVWWIRHARHDHLTGQHNPSLFLIYLSYWNAFECSIDAIRKKFPPSKSKHDSQVRDFILALGRVPTAEDIRTCYTTVLEPSAKLKARDALTIAERTKPEISADQVMEVCFQRKPESERLYNVRNDIDHGNIREFEKPTSERVARAFAELVPIVISLMNAAMIC